MELEPGGFMALYAISDLHLAVGVNKPMDVFGSEWADYMTRLRVNWLETVGEDDTVLMPGDFCWATYLPEALPDFQWLHALPGQKILTKGNHDYWWTTRSKLDAFLLAHGLSSIRILHHDAVRVDSWAICGTRGWKSPGDEDFSAEDRKIYLRELQRLQLSLQAAESLQTSRLMVLLHYPPFNAQREPGEYVALMQAHGVACCLYGHLHGRGRYAAIQGERDGIEYRLVAADNLQFRPVRID
jgi:predicted phosphohydrolase